MRCFACDASSASRWDGPTKRYYCTTCFNAIMDDLTSMKKDDIIITDGDVNMEELDDSFTSDSDASEMSEVWTR